MVEFRFKDPMSPGINYLIVGSLLDRNLVGRHLEPNQILNACFLIFPLAPIGCRFNRLFNQVQPPLGNFFTQANLKKSNTLTQFITSDDYFQHQGLIEDSGLFCIVNYFVNNLQ